MKTAACLLMVPGLVAASAAFGGPDDGAWSGGIEIGYRSTNVDGSEDKYREDVNLSDDALRVFGMDLRWRPARGGLLDEVTIAADGLGGEPHASALLTARKVGAYTVEARWRASDFFRRDEGYFFREGGDLHTWDTRRDFYALDVRTRPAEWLSLRFGGDRLTREGGSTTSRDIQRDEFILQRPVDQRATTWWLGAGVRMGWADLDLEQRLGSWRNRWLLRSGPTEGVDPLGATLHAYSQLQVQDADAPISRVTLGGRPSDRIRFSASWLRMDAELDFRVDGRWRGLDFDDSPSGLPPAPYEAALANSGRVERTTDVWKADLGFRVGEGLELTVDGARRTYDQTGSIDWSEAQTGGKEEGDAETRGTVRNELTLDTLGLTAAWQPARTLLLSAGAGWQRRRAGFQLAGPERETTRTLLRAGLRWRPGEICDVRLQAESGQTDDPHTPVSPTDSDRVKFDLRIRPAAALTLSFRFKNESSRNDLATPLGQPTDDTPPAASLSTAEFDVVAWGATIAWQAAGKLSLSLAYDRTGIDSNADLVYVTGYSFFPVFDVSTTLDQSRYSSDQDALHAEARLGPLKGWSASLLATATAAEGTFPMDWRGYGAEVRYAHRLGWHARVRWDRLELDETNPYAGSPDAPTPDINDYDADLVTLAVGIAF